MKYSIDSIVEAYNNGVQQKYIFFWGHQPDKNGLVKSSCFSQWWPSAFVVNDIIYKTAEHWMMAKKAELFGDVDVLSKILESKSPAEAKKLGREVQGYDEALWLQNRYNIVLEGNLYKFRQHIELKEFLLNTNNRIIVEASPVDEIWGIGMAKDSPSIINPNNWKGLNLLGFALMEARDILLND